MKAVIVEYQVKPEYVEQNKANIRKVMSRLKAEPIAGMLYSTYMRDDEQSFVHINISRDQETLSKLGELEEFKEFRIQLKESGPISPPQATPLTPVAAGFDL